MVCVVGLVCFIVGVVHAGHRGHIKTPQTPDASKAVADLQKELQSMKTQKQQQENLVKSMQTELQSLSSRVQSLTSYVHLTIIKQTKQYVDQTCTTCPSGYTRFGGSCYSIHHDNVRWGVAKDFCERAGADLVSIETKQENTFLRNFWKQNPPARGYTPNSVIWASGSDEGHEGAWQWRSTGQWIENRRTFTNWRHGNPDNKDGVEHCLQLTHWTDEWNDTGCLDTGSYICERVL